MSSATPMDISPIVSAASSPAATQGQVVARREVCEYGLLPVQSFFPRLDGPSAALALVRKLHAVARPASNPNAPSTSRFVSVEDVSKVLALNHATTKIIVNTLEAVVPEEAVVVDEAGNGPTAVSVHALGLFLFIQLHSRQGTLANATEVWPSVRDLECHEAPLSPTQRKSSPTTSPSRGKKVKHQQNRKWFQEQLQHHLQHLSAFPPFVRRNLHYLLLLSLDTLPATNELPPGASISADEVDRLGLLLRPTDPAKQSQNISQLLGEISTANTASLQLVEQWLQVNTADAESDAGSSEAARHVKGGGIGSGTVTKREGMVDMHGIVKGTVVRGEDLCPAGELRISDCHDVVIYGLTPLKLASIFGCSDATIVLGPVGQFLRIERCERLQLIVATKRVTISTCHDCTLFLGVNRPPCLIGDNRFVQMAPYCTQYDALATHMARVGVSPEDNKWDQAITVAHTNQASNSRIHAPDSPKTGSAPTMFGNSDGMMIGRASWTLLPPHKLLPFVIPFKGSSGNLGGGGTSDTASSSEAPAADSASAQAPNPFPLPPTYELALNKKVQGVADLRQAVKSAVLEEPRKKELQAVIQAHFKEWLINSGNMRQIYDLARLEREEG